MANIRQLIDRLGITLALLFSSAAVLITLAAVRLAIESRLDEIRVLALVGATRGQLRRPFLYFGAMYGFGGGLVATMILAVALNSVEEPLGSLFASYGLAVQISGFDLIFLVCSGLGALVLGVVGAWLALRQRLGVINDMSVRSA
jgi:cell division transport system permease protein